MTWKDLVNTSGISQTLTRANSCLGLKTIYKLSAGGTNPTVPLTRECDCSGFVAWAVGIPRELPPGSNHWFFTDSIWGGGSPVKPGLFSQMELPQSVPGDLLVYPHSGDAPGHVGIIAQVDHNRPSMVIHCSHGNFAHFGDAVRVTDPAVFLATNHPTRCMRLNYEVLKSFLA